MIYNILYIEYTIGYHSGFTWPHQCGWAAGSERVRLIGITEFSICVQSILNFHCVLMGWWFSILVLLEQSLRLYHFMHGLACGLAVSCGTTYNTNLGLRPNCQHTFRPDIVPSNKKNCSLIFPPKLMSTQTLLPRLDLMWRSIPHFARRTHQRHSKKMPLSE